MGRAIHAGDGEAIVERSPRSRRRSILPASPKSMAPIMSNIQRDEPRGNEFIDVDWPWAPSFPVETSYNERIWPSTRWAWAPRESARSIGAQRSTSPRAKGSTRCRRSRGAGARGVFALHQRGKGSAGAPLRIRPRLHGEQIHGDQAPLPTTRKLVHKGGSRRSSTGEVRARGHEIKTTTRGEARG